MDYRNSSAGGFAGCHPENVRQEDPLGKCVAVRTVGWQCFVHGPDCQGKWRVCNQVFNDDLSACRMHLYGFGGSPFWMALEMRKNEPAKKRTFYLIVFMWLVCDIANCRGTHVFQLVCSLEIVSGCIGYSF